MKIITAVSLEEEVTQEMHHKQSDYMGLHLVVSWEIHLLTFLSQWTLFSGCKLFGHKDFMWD